MIIHVKRGQILPMYMTFRYAMEEQQLVSTHPSKQINLNSDWNLPSFQDHFLKI